MKKRSYLFLALLFFCQSVLLVCGETDLDIFNYNRKDHVLFANLMEKDLDSNRLVLRFKNPSFSDVTFLAGKKTFTITIGDFMSEDEVHSFSLTEESGKIWKIDTMIGRRLFLQPRNEFVLEKTTAMRIEFNGVVVKEKEKKNPDLTISIVCQGICKTDSNKTYTQVCKFRLVKKESPEDKDLSACLKFTVRRQVGGVVTNESAVECSDGNGILISDTLRLEMKVVNAGDKKTKIIFNEHSEVIVSFPVYDGVGPIEDKFATCSQIGGVEINGSDNWSKEIDDQKCKIWKFYPQKKVFELTEDNPQYFILDNLTTTLFNNKKSYVTVRCKNIDGYKDCTFNEFIEKRKPEPRILQFIVLDREKRKDSIVGYGEEVTIRADVYGSKLWQFDYISSVPFKKVGISAKNEQGPDISMVENTEINIAGITGSAGDISGSVTRADITLRLPPGDHTFVLYSIDDQAKIGMTKDVQIKVKAEAKLPDFNQYHEMGCSVVAYVLDQDAASAEDLVTAFPYGKNYKLVTSYPFKTNTGKDEPPKTFSKDINGLVLHKMVYVKNKTKFIERYYLDTKNNERHLKRNFIGFYHRSMGIEEVIPFIYQLVCEGFTDAAASMRSYSKRVVINKPYLFNNYLKEVIVDTREEKFIYKWEFDEAQINTEPYDE
jgi:hypothetical protein